LCVCVQYRATCSLHCDAKYKGYYDDNVRECHTVFCDVPVWIKVIKADLRVTGTTPEKVRRHRLVCCPCGH
jgi:hypothetical protein